MSNDLNSYHFRKGTEVEISSNDNGFRGAWYSGTVIRSKNTNNRSIQVEYNTLMANESGTKPLRETLDVVQLRPLPPRENRERDFNFSDEVDAYYNDGWWEGVVTDVLPGDRYSVFFRATREQLEFGRSDLRLHREWVHGKWVPPLEEQEPEASINLKVYNKEKFIEGTLVEVRSDEDGFQGAWFAATIVEQLSTGSFFVEYKSLRNDDDTEYLKESIDSIHVRPCPPNEPVDSFCLFDEVDALYNDGWWVGIISKIVGPRRYEVYFRGTNEEMVFEQSDLRRHLEWVSGKWVCSSMIR